MRNINFLISHPRLIYTTSFPKNLQLQEGGVERERILFYYDSTVIYTHQFVLMTWNIHWRLFRADLLAPNIMENNITFHSSKNFHECCFSLLILHLFFCSSGSFVDTNTLQYGSASDRLPGTAPGTINCNKIWSHSAFFLLLSRCLISCSLSQLNEK